MSCLDIFIKKKLNYKKNLQAISIKMADPLILEGDVLQHPTTPVINETNMKKKAVMKSAIIARPISEKVETNNGIIDFHISRGVYILFHK